MAENIDESRLRKISSNLNEEDRKKSLETADEKRKDIERIIGHDVVNHEKLIEIADRIWNSVPFKERATYSSQDWMTAIHNYYTKALLSAEKKLQENSNNDGKMFAAKVRTLRQTFARQVLRAMTEVAESYKNKK